MERARCATTPGDFFHENGYDREQILETRKICEGCDVRTECLEYALSNNESHGICGGFTGDQRYEILQRRKRGGKR
jgi:WhiB family redox-sensing transcriptional regulator